MKTLAEILIQYGLVSISQIDEAMRFQSHETKKLCDVLIEIGYLTRRNLSFALSAQAGLPFQEEIRTEEIYNDIVYILPEYYLAYHNIIPLYPVKDTNAIRLALSYPFNLNPVDDVQILTNRDIEVVIVPEEEINESLKLLADQRAAGAEGLFIIGIGS